MSSPITTLCLAACCTHPQAHAISTDSPFRSMDLTMLALLNAKERDVSGWTDLFAQADPRYKFLGAKTPAGSRMSIMEAVWEP